jgi:hypothetical protein
VVACLSHLRIDEVGIRGHQQGGAVGRGARHGFGSDHSARAGAILDHDRHALRATDLLGHQASHEVGTGARRDRNDDLDRSRRLRPCTVTAKREHDDRETGNAKASEPNH